MGRTFLYFNRANQLKFCASLIFIFFCISAASAQVGIGTEIPHSSSLLELSSTSKGLLVPVVRNANADNPIALSASITTQMNKARDGSASPSDLTGGTITVTNVGVFGVDGGTPIITPGQAAILAMGRIIHKPWVVDDSIVIRPIMQLTFSFDHRIIDGALGSRALASVASYLADPALDELLLKD